jgi:ABC-type antimicrobial peptide transport system permease subunit
VLRHYVGPEHFATLGVPLRAGRIFTDADRADAPRVVVISESAARQFFPAGDAIGQRVWFDGSTLTSPDSSGEIVGIVGDVKYDPPLGERTMASFYTPYRQFTYGWRVYFVKLARDAQAARPAIAEAVRRAAPGLPMRNVRALKDIVSASRAAPKRAASGTSVLALLGLALAVGGIWALVSHATAQRTRDLAIRMAHGATAAGVVRLVLRDGLAWPVAGLVAGTVITLASSGVLRAALYGVAPGDPRVVTVGAVVCLLSAVGACLGPAWRAAQGDPITVLRSD